MIYTYIDVRNKKEKRFHRYNEYHCALYYRRADMRKKNYTWASEDPREAGPLLPVFVVYIQYEKRVQISTYGPA